MTISLFKARPGGRRVQRRGWGAHGVVTLLAPSGNGRTSRRNASSRVALSSCAWRAPVGLALGVLVPVIILVILGSAGGLQKTIPGSNPPVTYMTTYVPVLIGLVLVMIALISLPIVLVNQREHAFLRRLSTTPVAPRWLAGRAVRSAVGPGHVHNHRHHRRDDHQLPGQPLLVLPGQAAHRRRAGDEPGGGYPLAHSDPAGTTCQRHRLLAGRGGRPPATAQPCGRQIMSTVTRAAACTVRIAAVTAAASVLADAVAAAATTKRRGAGLRPGMAGRAPLAAGCAAACS